MREDDQETLEKIKSTIGVGKIYKKDCTYSRMKGTNSRDQSVFHINSIWGLSKFKEFLSDVEFHTKKRGDMEKFFEIFELIRNKSHLTIAGQEQIKEISTAMNSKNRSNWKKK